MDRAAAPFASRGGSCGSLVLSTVVAVTALSIHSAWAHQPGVSYSDIAIEDGRVRYDLTVANHDLTEFDADRDEALSNEEVLTAYPSLRRRFERTLAVTAGGTPCPLTLQDFVVDPSGAITFRLRGKCPDATPVRVAYGLLASTGAPGHNLATIRFRGTLAEHVFTRSDTEVTLGEIGLTAALRRFFVLGVEHIVTGYDHMLFLVALLLVGGGLAALVGIVTAFTVAHSVTLALATLEVVTLPSRLVESAIALSIAWVALENIVLDRRQGRWRITFAFGLVHGFGFATILREMHLPTQNLVASLLAFNVGVETGQVLVVLLAYPLIVGVQRLPWRRAAVGVLSGVILALALYWFMERAFA